MLREEDTNGEHPTAVYDSYAAGEWIHRYLLEVGGHSMGMIENVGEGAILIHRLHHGIEVFSVS